MIKIEKFHGIDSLSFTELKGIAMTEVKAELEQATNIGDDKSILLLSVSFGKIDGLLEENKDRLIGLIAEIPDVPLTIIRDPALSAIIDEARSLAISS